MKRNNRVEYLIDARPLSRLTPELDGLLNSIFQSYPALPPKEVHIEMQRIELGDSRGNTGDYFALVWFTDPRSKSPLELLIERVTEIGFQEHEVIRSIQLREILKVLANDLELDVEGVSSQTLANVIEKCSRLIDLGDWKEKLAADLRTEFNLPIRGNMELSPADPD